MIASVDEIGLGIYTPEEAAFYARVKTQLLKRWLFGDARGPAVIVPEVKNGDDRIVTFLDLVQALAIRSIRTAFNIPLQKIRDAAELARSQFGVNYPFAMKHTTYLLNDQKKKGHGEIVIRVGSDNVGSPERFVQLSGKNAKNFVIKEVAELYLDDLRFGGTDGLADLWKPYSAYGDAVILDPSRRFGEPIVESCGYTVNTLWFASIDEGGVTQAADAFGIPESAVKVACKFYQEWESATA